MEDKIHKKKKPKPWELVNPIIPLECLEKEDLKPSKYINHVCHKTPGDSALGKYLML